MPGPAPKRNPARRNRPSTAATLHVVHDVEAPELPGGLWHKLTQEWWDDIWASPMAPEFDSSDRHGLFALAMLVNDFWMAESASDRAKLSAEIRLQRQCFGLTPIDRRRLQWEIERTDEAVDKGRKRRSTTQKTGEAAGGDPLSALRAV
jgi:hypothetical protein